MMAYMLPNLSISVGSNLAECMIQLQSNFCYSCCPVTFWRVFGTFECKLKKLILEKGVDNFFYTERTDLGIQD